MNIENIFKEALEGSDIQLSFYKEKNRSCIAGKDHIFIGSYDDKELMVISFFHELGHAKTNAYSDSWCDVFETKYEMEKDAWVTGYRLARKMGIKFSKNARKWARDQLNSYKGWEEREIGPNWRSK